MAGTLRERPRRLASELHLLRLHCGDDLILCPPKVTSLRELGHIPDSTREDPVLAATLWVRQRANRHGGSVGQCRHDQNPDSRRAIVVTAAAGNPSLG
jgi:hypothetical protein